MSEPKRPAHALKCVHCPYTATGTMETTVKAAMVDHYVTVHGPAYGPEGPPKE